MSKTGKKGRRTTKKYRALQEQIVASVNAWYSRLGIDADLRSTFLDERHPDEPGRLADTVASWEYRAGTFRWYMPALLEEAKVISLDGVIVHEIVHYLTAPLSAHLKSGFGEQEEFAVESIARAILALAAEGA
jgi:hypothetical protein